MSERPEIPMYPALAVLEKRTPPLRYGHEPYWRAPVTPPTGKILIPSWNWSSLATLPQGERPLTLDVNGMYLAAAGGAVVAHGNLKHTGELSALPHHASLAPGYYEITVPYWGYSGIIVSPLGDNGDRLNAGTVWVTHATLELLLELAEETDALGSFGIVDSWTCSTATNFRGWVGRLRPLRKELIADVRAAHPQEVPDECKCAHCSQYTAFKEGYSAALSMMLTGEKCTTRRPDWAHTVQSYAAASTWRKAWRFTQVPGTHLASMGDVDEITIGESHLSIALAMPKPPFRFDNSGVTLGAFKIKTKRTPVVTNRPAALTFDIEDVF